ncbi:ethanolamine utilization protein [Clostridiaceae bacterium 14S0207]|nr:ethanolamine utilization protein [Clostridiaceae bacterium 14S0207]
MNALGIVELNSIAKGIEITDIMLKSAELEVIYSRHICPGKYMIILTGDVGSVDEAVETIKKLDNKYILATFILPNADERIINGINKKYNNIEIKAIGVMEFTSVACGIIALDKALKNGEVQLVKFTLGNLIGGKCYFIITGVLSSVSESMKVAKDLIDSKKIIHSAIIPSPDKNLISCL